MLADMVVRWAALDEARRRSFELKKLTAPVPTVKAKVEGWAAVERAMSGAKIEEMTRSIARSNAEQAARELIGFFESIQTLIELDALDAEETIDVFGLNAIFLWGFFSGNFFQSFKKTTPEQRYPKFHQFIELAKSRQNAGKPSPAKE